MRRVRTVVTGLLAAAVALGATGCYPPSQTPTTQPVPPGGRVVAVGPVLTEMDIQDALPDLSEILYSEDDFLVVPGDPTPYRFWVYDDTTGTTTSVPVGLADDGMASLSPDGRSVVFSSDDSRLSATNPVADACYRPNFPFTDTAAVCSELYIFHLDTGQTQQLTGLDGSSGVDHLFPVFTPDGQSIDFTATPGGSYYHPNSPASGPESINIATGQITNATVPPQVTSWDRGTHQVSWDAETGTLTSTDSATGAVTTLWSDPRLFFLASATDNGRFIVVSDWVTDQEQIFRLIDTDTGSVRVVTTQWISEDGSRYAVAQQNVAPDATDRLVIAPVPPA